MKLNGIKICVDFDGTIVDDFDKSTRMIKPMAFEVLKKLEAEGAYLVFWSLREGKYLTEALDFCKSHGIIFKAVNEIPEHMDYRKGSGNLRRKPDAHFFIDDRNVGGFIGWDKIEEYLIK